MAASRVGDLVAAAFTSTTNNATLAGTTSAAVSAGDTAFGFVGVRGGTLGEVTSISGLPLDAVVELVVTTRAGSAGNSQCRMYCPTGMASSTVVTFNLDAAATRKVGWMEAWTGVANANNAGTANANAASGSSFSSGTTGAVAAPVGGVHFMSTVVQSAATIGGINPGSDTEGTMTETVDAEVGASNFNRLEVQWNTWTAAHAGGETATSTAAGGTPAAWTGLQVLWDGATSGITLNAPLATGAGTGQVPAGAMTVDSTPVATGAGVGQVPAGVMTATAPVALGQGVAFSATHTGTAAIITRPYWHHPVIMPWTTKGGFV